MVASNGREPHRFSPLIDLYRQTGAKAGHATAKPRSVDQTLDAIDRLGCVTRHTKCPSRKTDILVR
jgi:hypothetical protein